MIKSRWGKRGDEERKRDIPRAPWKKTWKRVTTGKTTEKESDGNEANKEETAWESCGSKEAPNKKQYIEEASKEETAWEACGSKEAPRTKTTESEKEKEARLEARRAKQQREWRLRTTNVNNSWFSRDGIGERIFGYMKDRTKWEPWAGRVTGMILENEDWELKAIMMNEQTLIANIEQAMVVLKEAGFCVLTRDDGTQVIMEKRRDRPH